MKNEHGTNDSVHTKAKKSALSGLSGLMDSLASPKLAGKGEKVTGVEVVRKTASKHVPVKKAKVLDQHEEVETPEHEASESPDFEHGEEEEGKEYHASRAEPGDTTGEGGEHESLGKPEEVDAALKKFLVKGKKHIKKA